MNSSGYQILPPVLMYSGPAFCERQSAKVATERPKLFATCSGDIILSRENLNTTGLLTPCLCCCVSKRDSRPCAFASFRSHKFRQRNRRIALAQTCELAQHTASLIFVFSFKAARS